MALKPVVPAPIEQLLRRWQADEPAFFWSPTRPEFFLRDQQRGLIGVETRPTKIGYGGNLFPIGNSSQGLTFPSNFGIGASGNFFSQILIWVPNPQAVTGVFLKIGATGVGGVGIGGGNTTADNTGNTLIVLRENLAWEVGPSNAFVPGFNVITFSKNSEVQRIYAANLSIAASFNCNSGFNAPDANIGIGGYSNRGTNVTVCAVALWPTDYTNIQRVEKENLLAAPLLGLTRQGLKTWFTPRWITPAAVAGTPTGTLATTNANDTSSASGNTTPTGTLARTNANDTSTASGNTTPTGTLARTNANDTVVASGSSTITGTLAKTNADDTVSASGTTTPTGVLAKTNADDTLAASGTSGNDVVGTVNYTNINDTGDGAGTTTPTGALARTNSNDTSAGAGTTTPTGTSSTTNANDTLVASGAAGTITGTCVVTNGNDACVASGSSVTPSTSVGGGGSGGGKREILHARRRKPVKSADEEIKELLDGVIEPILNPAKPSPKPVATPAKQPEVLAKALALKAPIPAILAPAPKLRTQAQLEAEEEQAEMQALLHYFY